MARRGDISVCESQAATKNSGSKWPIVTPSNVWYWVYIDTTDDVVFRKSSDYGLTWGVATIVFSGTAVQLSVWYDRWSGIAAGLIHCAYTESATDDTLYRTINTESSDALSTQTTIFAGASTANGAMLSIARMRGGNVLCRTMIDAGAEGEFRRLANANVPNGAWDAARTINETNATLDQIILMPGFAADNQDALAIFYDNSATELSRQTYDDSANSWTESSIDTDCTFPAAATTTYPHFNAVPDLDNSRLVVVMWNAVDTANADLRGWVVTEGAITAFGTVVVANGTDDQGLCSISIDTDTDYWYVFYAGKSDGSETFFTAVNLYYKVSTDQGATWGAENLLSRSAQAISFIASAPNFTGGERALPVIFGDFGVSNGLKTPAVIAQPSVRGNIGI